VVPRETAVAADNFQKSRLNDHCDDPTAKITF